MKAIWAVVLLSGCAVQPQDDGLLDIAEKTPEQAAYERQQDIDSVQKTEDWAKSVCAATGEERKKLQQETVEKYGWQIACPG